MKQPSLHGTRVDRGCRRGVHGKGIWRGFLQETPPWSLAGSVRRSDRGPLRELIQRCDACSAVGLGGFFQPESLAFVSLNLIHLNRNTQM